ncbi:collagen-like protein [Streptomyces sp. BH105]|uniref:collagen-like protein n=1 Tax=Streptomyces sp. BH105 TaxID=3410408 RepID=UPI003CF330A5
MTRAERLFYRSRHLLWIAAALLFLGGALLLAFLQIQRAEGRADQLAAEADRRGTAVTTLATDVRTLRSQLQAAGKKPKAPDPAKAVKDLPDRAEVPVPIPGPQVPKGSKGSEGEQGSPGPAITPSPGAPGLPGADSTVPGEQGVPGADSTVLGPQGERGEQGPPPSGWTFTHDGVTYECTRDDGSTHYTCEGSGGSEPTQQSGLLSLGLDPYRRLYP